MKCEKTWKACSLTPSLCGQLYLQGSILMGEEMESYNGTWSGLARSREVGVISMHHRQSQWGDYLGNPLNFSVLSILKLAQGVKVQVVHLGAHMAH